MPLNNKSTTQKWVVQIVGQLSRSCKLLLSPSEVMYNDVECVSIYLKQFKDFYLITGGSRQAERFLEEEQKRFDQTVAPTLPQFPRLIDIKIEAM